MFVERPDDWQWQELVTTYGHPTFADQERRIHGSAEDKDAMTRRGDVILLIFNLGGSCVFVKRKGAMDWSFPTGPIGPGEGIIEAAHREAMEQAGVTIVPIGVPLCQRVNATSRDTTSQRWRLVVVAETATSDLRPEDQGGVEARLFDIPPTVHDHDKAAWMAELHGVATRFMRSMDAMDGI